MNFRVEFLKKEYEIFQKIHLTDGDDFYTSPLIYDGDSNTDQAKAIITEAWQNGEYDGAEINLLLGKADLCPDWDEEGKYMFYEFDEGVIQIHKHIHRGVYRIAYMGIYDPDAPDANRQILQNGQISWPTFAMDVSDPDIDRSECQDLGFAKYSFDLYLKMFLRDGQLTNMVLAG